MKNIGLNKRILFLLAFASIALLTGCGGGGGNGDYSPIYPPGDIPTDYVTADTFDKKPNEIYTYSADAECIAVNLPSNESYLLQITNKSPKRQTIRLIEEVVKASSRASADDINCIEDVPQYFDIDRMLADKAHIEARMRMASNHRRLQCKTVNASRMAKSAAVDHSYEKEGECYPVWTCDIEPNSNPYLLNRCKLVKVTPHAKFFVDQNPSFGYDPQAEKMEQWVLDSEFGLAKVFDGDTVNMYDTLVTYFGGMHDVDNDGRISVVITPFLSSISNGSLLGLFTDRTMDPDFNDENDGPRDMVLLAPPSYLKTSNEGKNELLTNLIHECQHLVNYSQRAFDNKGEFIFNSTAFAQELGFDEGCSICAETIFRQLRGKSGYRTLYDYRGSSTVEYAGNSSRFANYLIDQTVSNVFPFDISNFNYDYRYGRNGLFMFYLYDRFGKDSFKKLIQQGWQGHKLREVIPLLLGTPESLDDLQRDWHFALQNEYIKTEQNKANLPVADARFQYSEWLRLDASPNKTIRSEVSVASNNTIMYKINSGKVSDNNYRFFIIPTTSEIKNNYLTLNIIKLPK